MDPLFEIEFDRAARGSRDAARNLHRQLRQAILDGRLPPLSRVPATRNAPSLYGVSRNTAAEVYDRLINEGYLVARQGSGTFVAARPPSSAARRSTPHALAVPHRMNAFWLRADVTAAMGFWRESATQRTPEKSKAAAVDLRPALVDPRLFPFATFRRVTAKQLRTLERKPASYRSPQGNQGNYQLREAIRQHIAIARAVVGDADDILVTSGAQQAFDLLARVLVVPGETVVAVEDPGYPPMRVAFAAAGARLVPVGVDAEGLVVEQIPPDAGVICLCPSHQFPLGVTMSARRRRELVAFARRRNAVIVEDDYDGEFRYDADPLAALRTPDASDVVFYVGTFSKCMLPALRLGFVVAPAWAMPTLVAAKNCLDWHCSMPVQLGVAAFIAEGHLAHHVRRMRRIYKERRDVLLEGLARDFADSLEPISSAYGMHVGAFVRASIDADAVADRALRSNVKLHSFSRYWLGPQAHHGLIFGYGSVDTAGIKRALSVLRQALRQ